jgi:protein-disulfide isomerase
MYGRFLTMLFRRALFVLLLICLGCSAQSGPAVAPDVAQRVERQVRVFYSIPSGVKITLSPLRTSEFPNYDALTITLGDEEHKYDFLLSKDHNTLLRLTKLDLTKDPYAEVMKKIDVKARPTRGNKDAKVVVVNYDDFQCPFCSRMHEMLFPDLLKEYGDKVVFIYKDFPLAEIHPWATHAAVNANCLAAQNNEAYWDFADYIHANQREINSSKVRDEQYAALDKLATEQGQKHKVDATKLQACIKAQNSEAIKASVKEGSDVGVTATPTIFVNGQELDGAVPLEEMRAALDDALQRAGIQPPAHPPAAKASESPSSK